MKLALIAGNRRLPLLFAAAAKKHNPKLELIIVAFKGETDPRLSRFSRKTYWFKVGCLEEIISVLKQERINEAVMIGQISPWRLFASRRYWDRKMFEVYKEVDDFRSHSIFSRVIKEIEREGIKFISSASYLEDYLAEEGIGGREIISDKVKKDIEIGFNLGRQIVDFDVGQTLIVKNRAVVAVEALEGTDNAIKRAARICGEGFSMVKLSRHGHDVRFDLPVIGIDTIKLLARKKAAAVVLEAGKVIIIDKPKVLSLARRWGITVVGLRRESEIKDLFRS
ncbi:MAG: UDP-2,3-diacylglucosamine diphosphatase LpxI [Candidatus Omnitrophica bacterium]|nr:UDP-2,3-diacylglucosamine diphosphatase LpxI [Candidatus Omnitrophota bacterium]